jgi:rubrerythrin
MVKITCIVCGMAINGKNYNFNKEAFINSNSKEKIMYCPFCGAPIEYLIENGQEIKYDRNKLNQNSLKIIDHAVKLEVFNGDFYKKASYMAKDKNVKSMFKALSSIEYMHAKIHKKIAGIKEMPVLKDMDYSKYNTDKDLLAAACQREKHAVAYYKKYEKEIHEENISKIFNALSKVEEEHVELTGKQL